MKKLWAFAEKFVNHLPARTLIIIEEIPKKEALLTMDSAAITDR